MKPRQKHLLTEEFVSRNISILLVDDNRVNQFLGKKILHNLGIAEVDIAGNGVEAFECFKKKSYDIILTDLEMPLMNGYDLSKAIRSYENDGKRLTIIALSANATEEDRELAKDSGIDDYLTKPYSPQDLRDLLLKYLDRKTVIILEDMSSIQPENSTGSIQSLYNIFHNNRDDIKHFLHMLSGQIPSLTAEIKSGIMNDNWEQAFQAAHKLKSPVKMLAGSELESQLNLLTEQLRDKQHPETAMDNLEKISPALESLLVMVNRELESMT